MRTKNCARIFQLLLVLAATSVCAYAQGCLSYDPATVELTGTVSRKVLPGPPNYQSIRKGDRPETVWVLQLARAICVTGNADDVNEPERNVTGLQLTLDESEYARLRKLLGKRVRFTAKGKLFHAHTAHHRTSVLLAVEEIKKR